MNQETPNPYASPESELPPHREFGSWFATHLLGQLVLLVLVGGAVVSEWSVGGDWAMLMFPILASGVAILVATLRRNPIGLMFGRGAGFVASHILALSALLDWNSDGIGQSVDHPDLFRLPMLGLHVPWLVGWPLLAAIVGVGFVTWWSGGRDSTMTHCRLLCPRCGGKQAGLGYFSTRTLYCPQCGHAWDGEEQQPENVAAAMIRAQRKR